MNESKPTCGWNDSTPPFPGQQDVGALSRRLYCGGCCHFDREAWEAVQATIAELREELAQAQNALANSH
jgi:hypothetical protein